MIVVVKRLEIVKERAVVQRKNVGHVTRLLSSNTNPDLLKSLNAK